MKEYEPYLLTSLIRKLTELLHEHGDLPVFCPTYDGGDAQIETVVVEEEHKDIDRRSVMKRVYIQ